MQVGDKVRLIHGKEEGRVVKILDARQVEVEIEDGFRIPALKTELVIVAREESVLSAVEEEMSLPLEVFWKGLYLAFLPFNDRQYEVIFINDTSYKIHFIIGEEKDNVYKGIFSGICEPEKTIKLHEVSIESFEQWPDLLVQLMAYAHGVSEYIAPIVKRLKFKSSSFYKSKKLAPLINKYAFMFRLDMDAIKINAKTLEEEMNEKNTPVKVAITIPANEIDLHIEKLTNTSAGMSNNAMLQLQLDTFEKNLSAALAVGMEEIIFIHGVGNGVLKKEIHKYLSASKEIKFFQDAKKEKFGYGATLVRLK